MDDQREDRKGILSLIWRLHEEYYYFGTVACLIATAYLMFRWAAARAGRWAYSASLSRRQCCGFDFVRGQNRIGSRTRTYRRAANGPRMDDQIANRERSVVNETKLQVFWGGARRGIKFGATAGIAIMLIGCVVVWPIALLVPNIRQHVLADLQNETVLSAIGGTAAVTLLMAFYGAVPGAIIMGLSALRRVRRDQVITERK